MEKWNGYLIFFLSFVRVYALHILTYILTENGKMEQLSFFFLSVLLSSFLFFFLFRRDPLKFQVFMHDHDPISLMVSLTVSDIMANNDGQLSRLLIDNRLSRENVHYSICEHGRRKSDCAGAQSDQSLPCLHSKIFGS